MTFTWITVRPDQVRGVSCIRGLRRIAVATLVGMVADGMNEQEILEALVRERGNRRWSSRWKTALVWSACSTGQWSRAICAAEARHALAAGGNAGGGAIGRPHRS